MYLVGRSKTTPTIRTCFLVFSLSLLRRKESLESLEVEFVSSVKSTCYFRNHKFYVESVAPIFKTEVQSQIPINKDKMVSLFFSD